MAFFINILYMPVDEIEFDSMKIGLSNLGKKTAALVKIAQEGDCSKPDYSRGCELLKRATRPAGQGGKRKSRKKRGKGAIASRMYRKMKLSARKPKQEYAEKAIDILMNDPNFKTKDIAIKSQMIRNLALDLEDNAKKGGRRRKSRKKRRKRKSKRKTRNKRGGHHEALLLGALALSKIFKNKKKKTRKKRRR